MGLRSKWAVTKWDERAVVREWKIHQAQLMAVESGVLSEIARVQGIRITGETTQVS